MTAEQQIRMPDERQAATMLAVVQDEYGEPGTVLRLEQTEQPTIEDDEVLVRVAAAGVDRGVWHMVAGLPFPIRLAGFGLRRPKNRVPGMDVAGRVEAVGKDVTKLRLGDEVYGVAMGSFAEYARAKESRLAPRPAGLTAEQAAAVPVSAVTALQAVRDHGHVQPGQRVLVLGASGGVGSYAVQIAKAFGAEVTGVCSAAKVDLVRSLGADRVIDYTRGDPLEPGRYDVILDIGGNRRLSVLRRALTPRGTLVIVGGETGGRILGGVQRQIAAMLLSPFLKQKLGTFVAGQKAADLMALNELVASGALKPAVDRTYPLGEAAEAIRYLQDGSVRGKVVLTVRGR
ncbi:MAG: NAD(P)-dependent alcohol dehydrogenase [Blastococcus sp.]